MMTCTLLTDAPMIIGRPLSPIIGRFADNQSADYYTGTYYLFLSTY